MWGRRNGRLPILCLIWTNTKGLWTSNDGSEKVRGFSLGLIVLLVAVAACEHNQNDTQDRAAKLPNIVIFYADDLGYGDVGAYGATAVATPNIDALATAGVRFTDAHASAATCTPSRYSLLTGEYGFRSQAAILSGDAPAVIRPPKYTLPTMLREKGYTTAVVGKWHLGLGDGYVNWNEDVTPGPLEIGFDYSFILPATGDRVPTVYLENHRVVGLEQDDPLEVNYAEPIGDRPLGYQHPELLKVGADRQHGESIINGVSRIGYMKGGEAAEWVDEEFADVFTEKAIAFLQQHKDKPFFLYFPFHDPHVPRLPHERFQGKTALGPRGDAIVQMDWMTGRIIDALENLGIDENTLILFTSDNGPVLNDGYLDKSVELNGDHTPSGPFRGGKYSAYEAGARVPTVVLWPGRVRAGGVSDALVSQVDIFASLASLVGSELSDDSAIDSQDLLDVWLGESAEGRDYLFKQSVPTAALRMGEWKYIEPVEAFVNAGHFIAEKGIESGASLEPQLYDLSVDIAEENNLASERHDILEQAKIHLDAIRKRTGRKPWLKRGYPRRGGLLSCRVFRE